MAVKKKYNVGGREVMGQEIEFEPEAPERWNSYILEDGSKLRLKSVAASIVRLDEYLPTGDPIYLVNATPVIAVDVPESLKKKSE